MQLSTVGKVPKVDVVCAQVLQRLEGGGELCEVFGGGGERGTFENENCGLRVYFTVENAASSCLICEV